MTKNQDAIRRLFNVRRDNTGNMPSFPAIFPDFPAPVIHMTNSERGTKAEPIPGPHNVYGFLTTEPNAVVAPVHPKAMPVILREDDWDKWLESPAEEAMKLQRPWPNDSLKIVKRGADKED